MTELLAFAVLLAAVLAAAAVHLWLARRGYVTEQCQVGQHHRCRIDSPTGHRQCGCDCHKPAARAA